MSEMLLSVVMPVYNEVNTVEEIVKSVFDVGLNIELIIVDDCSTDGTKEKLKTLSEKYSNDKIEIFYQEPNQGKGAALREGFKHVSGEYTVIQDADKEYDPNEYYKLLKPVKKDNADVVYGSRFIGGDSHRVLYFWHYLGNRFLTLLSNMFTNLNLTDMETCYKLIRTDVLKKINIEQNRFGFEPEITSKLSKMNLKIYEVGISYYGRSYDEGKKIGWKDGFIAIYCIIKYGMYTRR